MKIKNLLYAFILLSAGLSVSGCDDFLTEEPKTVVSNDNLWKTEQEADAFMNIIHALFRYNYGSVLYIYRDRGMPFDYMAATYANPSNNTPTWSADNVVLGWLDIYKIITSCNILLENIGQASLSKERRDFYAGQANCILGYCYFDLLRCWGDATFMSHSEDFGPKERMPWRALAGYALSYYDKAIQQLPPASQLTDSEGHTVISKQVPSKGTAQMGKAHLLAWIAGFNDEPELYRGTADLIDSVINSREYELAGTVKELCDVVMSGNSKEGIWEVDIQDKYNETITVGSCIAGICQRWPQEPFTTPSTKRTSLRINNTTVYELYPDETDERRNEYFYKLDSMAGVSVSITQGAAYINKWRDVVTYKDGNRAGRIKAYNNNIIIFRYADALLLGAEAKANTGDEAGAIKLLNEVRRRAHAKEYDATEGDLKYAIFHERERELFLENGHRFYDAVRCHFAGKALREGFRKLTEQDRKNGGFFIPVSLLELKKNTLAKQTIFWQSQY